MTLTFPKRHVAIGTLAITAGLAGSVATAGTTNYLVTGQLGTAPSDIASPGGLDASSFELRLSFDEPTRFDNELTSFGAQTYVYVAETWSLAFLDDEGLIVEYDGVEPTGPELAVGNNYGYVVLNGGITGPDSGETRIEVGVGEAAQAGDGQSLEPSLLRSEFYKPELIEAAFTNQLIDIPDDMAFQLGEAFDELRDINLDIIDASLTAVSIDDGIVLDTADGTNDPTAIPSPTAAAGGVLLLVGVLARRRRDSAA